MKKLFNDWNHQQTMDWFEAEGVRLVTQEDECVFPASQDAMQIVNTLLRDLHAEGVALRTNHRVKNITPQGDGYTLHFANEQITPVCSDVVVATIGGCPSTHQLTLFESLGVAIEPPVPSLFTFNIPDTELHELMGCVVENAVTSLAGTKFKTKGALLVTHWGMSGPAILKLSSLAARHLATHTYQATLCVNWLGGANEEEARALLTETQHLHPHKLVANEYPSQLTARLWHFLLKRCQIDTQTKWNALTGKKLNKLIVTLTADTYPITGKNRYKEEFVTCGGVSLTNLQGTTLALKNHPHLFLAGEVLDVDAVTGGFNLQAAWTMGYVVAKNIAAICTSI
ncbi:MAG: aminoacetone oxidase family FAD-binding enzyme [Bacteroidaceae bacterium]|nr:aminoacetone oxidase family FAD-binding enzyme [Bacteroidaceae bacterium]